MVENGLLQHVWTVDGSCDSGLELHVRILEWDNMYGELPGEACVDSGLK